MGSMSGSLPRPTHHINTATVEGLPVWDETALRDYARAAIEAALAAAPQAEPVADDRPTWNVPHAVTIRCLRAAEDRIRAGEAPADVFADYGWGPRRGGSAAAPQWVSCAESLPEAGVEVLVRVDGKRGAAWSNSYMLVAFLSAYGDTWLQERHHAAPPLVGVTHWMPLPAAPRGQR